MTSNLVRGLAILAFVAGAGVAHAQQFINVLTGGTSGVYLSLIHISEPTRPY